MNIKDEYKRWLEKATADQDLIPELEKLDDEHWRMTPLNPIFKPSV
ncbi:hypothetical protein SAMN05216349_1173 [Oribacterium sp. KHPX15]|nr:hypothetical protein [Oribacterium sp. KHPX15]SEA56273.1 hypothetical protein SAMN05216349_1173 [Oribacterium sp. KHPX15]